MSGKEDTGCYEKEGLLPKPRQAALGLMYLVLVTLTNLIADAISKILVDHVSVFLVAMMRGFVMLVLVLPVMIYYSISLKDSANQWKLLSLRGVMSALSALARVAALNFAPLGDVSAITASTPILTALWSWLILGEGITLLEISFAGISLIGICLIAQPPDLFSQSSSNSIRNTLVIGVGTATLGSIFASLAVVLNRKLSKCDIYISPLVQVFYYSFISTTINIVAFGMTFSMDYSSEFPTTTQWLFLIAIGFLSLLKQLFLIGALRQEKAIYVTTFTYSVSIILAYTVQYLYFQESPTILSITGASLCIMGTVGFVFVKLQD
ncbi:Solute carrier family 35 member G1 [Holothuria leucospilota]|uniref:Solute carrier family 35 member G1 n=1 Tax=Holothuria leucospilota TaxID=206669 RepID=A0A9Q1HB20_HOLLE|nr:Solute carrier family 35 member G1 [Holothuria leucospilota]